ncbi:MAG: response regulator transcription factor [Mycobacteriales bacterium]
MPTVLIIEDEPKLRDLVRSYLERDGLSVLSTGSGAEGLNLIATASPDLIGLDLGRPDVGGETIAAEVRAASAIPIVVLTARAEEADRIRGFELGVDDYVVKPFSPRELVLRVRAVLRRGSDAKDEDPVRRYGGRVEIDEARRRVTVDGTDRELTPTEWNLLMALASQPGRVYSRLELINRARGHEFEGYERSVDSHVKNLRRKIETDPARPEIVLTVIGGGYRLGLTRDA